ncbi:MAG: PTS sugar transporter subunit IIA [Deltaproteobacteria bacterium]|nr:PTS sugar transporter subunit IIA [Deltaproteobacteria bacterium]
MPSIMLSEYLDPGLVFGKGTIKAGSKNDLLRQLASKVSNFHKGLSPGIVYKALLERESEHSTGLGLGLALPHALLDGIDRPVLAAAVLDQPIDFSADDCIPVDVVVMILSPSSGETIHLRILARVARLLTNGDMQEKLRKAGKRELFDILINEDKSHVY